MFECKARVVMGMRRTVVCVAVTHDKRNAAGGRFGAAGYGFKRASVAENRDSSLPASEKP